MRQRKNAHLSLALYDADYAVLRLRAALASLERLLRSDPVIGAPLTEFDRAAAETAVVRLRTLLGSWDLAAVPIDDSAVTLTARGTIVTESRHNTHPSVEHL